MKTLKSILVIGIILMASFVTPLRAQWNLAYSDPPGQTGFYGLYFADSLHGWFTGSIQNSYRILRTTNGGKTFEPQQTPYGAYPLYSIYMEDTLNGWAAGGAMYSGGPGVILRTTNGGQTWVNQIHSNNGTWNVITKVGNFLWFVGNYYNPGNGTTIGAILKTSDNGSNWAITYYPDLGFNDIEVIDEFNIVICSGIGGMIYRTSNGGNTWFTTHLNTNYQVEAIAFVNPSLGYALVTDFSHWPLDVYLYSTIDGGFTWSQRYVWLAQGQKMGLSVITNNGTIFVGGFLSADMSLSGILKSTDNGFTWNTVMQNTSHLNPWRIYTPDARHGWAASFGGAIYRYDYVEPPVVQPIPNALIQLGQPFVYQVQASGIGLNYTMTGQPVAVFIDYATGLIYGTPFIGGTYNVTVTVRDIDANVVELKFKLRVNRRPLFLPPPPPAYAWVDSLYQFILRAEDGDNDTISFTWLSKPSWLTFLTEGISSVVISGTPSINDTGYHQIAVLADDGYGGRDTLSWRLRVSVVTKVESLTEIPTEFSLSQNYPNPFNPVTTIRYALPQAIEVSLTIYNLLGQEVAVLVKEYQQAGIYQASFDASNLPGGTYFYRLQAGNYIQTKKMTLLK